MAKCYFQEIEKQFCKDLLGSTDEALIWLEDVNTKFNQHSKKTFKAFTYDFKGLYDSLKPDLVKTAMAFAMKQCCPDWSDGFCEWILSLVDFSLKSSVGLFENNWYIQKVGIPTGGSLCVQLANIAVYYVLYMTVYSKPNLMEKIKSAKRYIDDGGGFFVGTARQYTEWISQINIELAKYGLNIDEHTIGDVGKFISFLDIQFCFDCDGYLQTDLYVKETDARAYLHFDSSHPNYTYSGTVYSQCLRLRRIINCNSRLKIRLDELSECFLKSGYPHSMVNNISLKVLNMDRILDQAGEDSNSRNENDKPNKIRLVSTFGCDLPLVETVKKYEVELRKTKSFEKGSDQSIVQYVKKTGASLRNRLVKVKQLAVGNRFGLMKPCNRAKCKCCKMINEVSNVKINNMICKTAPGNCCSYNLIYLLYCKKCRESYIGRTTRFLSDRIAEHRQAYYHIIDRNIVEELSDDFSPGIHLVEKHQGKLRQEFDNTFLVYIVDNCGPMNMEVKEHKYIHRFNTLRPNGINTSSPFGISVLNS